MQEEEEKSEDNGSQNVAETMQVSYEEGVVPRSRLLYAGKIHQPWAWGGGGAQNGNNSSAIDDGIGLPILDVLKDKEMNMRSVMAAM